METNRLGTKERVSGNYIRNKTTTKRGECLRTDKWEQAMYKKQAKSLQYLSKAIRTKCQSIKAERKRELQTKLNN